MYLRHSYFFCRAHQQLGNLQNRWLLKRGTILWDPRFIAAPSPSFLSPFYCVERFLSISITEKEEAETKRQCLPFHQSLWSPRRGGDLLNTHEGMHISLEVGNKAKPFAHYLTKPQAFFLESQIQFISESSPTARGR